MCLESIVIINSLFYNKVFHTHTDYKQVFAMIALLRNMRTMVGWLHQYLRANITNSDGSAVVMMVRLAVLQFCFFFILTFTIFEDIRMQECEAGGWVVLWRNEYFTTKKAKLQYMAEDWIYMRISYVCEIKIDMYDHFIIICNIMYSLFFNVVD